jgi:phage FluMu protein Com
MAFIVTVRCDRCPETQEFDPTKAKTFSYIIDQDGVAREGEIVQNSQSQTQLPERLGRRRVMLPADWGLLELNVGHDKEVQELCPRCVELNRSFMKDPSRLLAEMSEDPKQLPSKNDTEP